MSYILSRTMSLCLHDVGVSRVAVHDGNSAVHDLSDVGAWGSGLSWRPRCDVISETVRPVPRLRLRGTASSDVDADSPRTAGSLTKPYQSSLFCEHSPRAAASSSLVRLSGVTFLSGKSSGRLSSSVRRGSCRRPANSAADDSKAFTARMSPLIFSPFDWEPWYWGDESSCWRVVVGSPALSHGCRRECWTSPWDTRLLGCASRLPPNGSPLSVSS